MNQVIMAEELMLYLTDLLGEGGGTMIGKFLKNYGGTMLSTGVSGAAMMLPQMFMMKQMQSSLPQSITGQQNKQTLKSFLPELPDLGLHINDMNKLVNNTLMYGHDITNGHLQDVNNKVAYKIANNVY